MEVGRAESCSCRLLTSLDDKILDNLADEIGGTARTTDVHVDECLRLRLSGPWHGQTRDRTSKEQHKTDERAESGMHLDRQRFRMARLWLAVRF